MRRRAFLTALAAGAPLAALAQKPVSQAQALSGGRFIAGDSEFLLADVMAPSLYTLSDKAPPYFDESRRALEALLSDGVVIEDAMAATRWGVRRIIARRADDGETLQQALVRNGAVRVAPESGDHDRIAALLELEADARCARRGLWAAPSYRVFHAENAWGAVDGYHLVEGKVARAEKHGGRFYLNFGEDFRTDFTAGAASSLYNQWLRSGIDLAALGGETIRVRGFVEAINGPSIDLKHPMQIEHLE